MPDKIDNTEDYIYPDIDDALTTSLISKLEPFTGYWEKSERYVLDIIKKNIQKRIRKENSFFLDAGCGDGRLLSEFEGFFDNIVAVDPDVKRVQKAKEILKERGFFNKICFRPIAIGRLDNNQKFDVILCSHVIQHVDGADVELILRKLTSLLKKNGLMAIMTGHSGSNQDRYVKDYFADSEIVEETISKDEFEALVCNDNGVLPIRLFSSRSITQILKKLNLRILEIRSFHILSKLYGLDSLIFRDRLFNHFSFLKAKVGRDMLILATLDGQQNHA